MVKNEADIIESYVRHCFSFVDEMIIVDHSSSDATGEILRQLQAEGLALTIKSLQKAELVHAEVMNDLMWEAIEKHGADLVLPFDADEFLVNTDTVGTCRDLLQQLDPKKVYWVPWKRYEPLAPEEDQEKFLLYRPCQREPGFAPLQKTIIGAGIAKKHPFILLQGGHYVYWETIDGVRYMVPHTVLTNMHIAHYHWRSDGQYTSKVVVSWINNVAKYSTHTAASAYLKLYFDKIAAGERVRPTDFLQDGETFDLRPYCTAQVLRYSHHAEPNVLKNLMQASELIAEAYIEEKVLRRKQIVTVLLVFLGDVEAFRVSLLGVLAQKYPYKELVVLNLSGQQSEAVKEIVRTSCGELPAVYGEFMDAPKQMADFLEQRTNGKYVQWVFPGDVLLADKLQKMVTCLNTQDYTKYTFLIADAAQAASMPVYALPLYWRMPDGEVFPQLESDMLLRELLIQGGEPSGGISAALFRRETMSKCKWLAECFMGTRPLFLMMYDVLLRNDYTKGKAGILGGYRGLVLKRASWAASAEDFVWRQLEWFAVLENRKTLKCFSAEDWRQALRRLLANKDLIDAYSQEVESNLWQQYESLLASIKNLLHGQ